MSTRLHLLSCVLVPVVGTAQAATFVVVTPSTPSGFRCARRFSMRMLAPGRTRSRSRSPATDRT